MFLDFTECWFLLYLNYLSDIDIAMNGNIQQRKNPIRTCACINMRNLIRNGDQLFVKVLKYCLPRHNSFNVAIIAKC